MPANALSPTSKLSGYSESVRLSQSSDILKVTAMRFSQCGFVDSLQQDDLSRDALPMERQFFLETRLFRSVALSVIEREDARELTSRAVVVNQEDQSTNLQVKVVQLLIARGLLNSLATPAIVRRCRG